MYYKRQWSKKKYLPNVENSKKTFKEAGYQTFLEVQSEDLLDDTSFRVVEDRDKVLEFRVKKRWKNDYFLSFFNNHLIDYPAPINLSYYWSFGSLAGICLVIQIVTGVFLAMHYTPHIDFAFTSIEYIMRDIHYGWVIRYAHANGASMFFIVVYAHIWRGLYFGSYMAPRQLLWCTGVVIFLLMMATAFMGYVLPWGQMSFWGATVITNMVTVIPKVGNRIVEWLWGGYCIENPTLNRFFSFHYIMPFVIAGLVLIHLALLHKDGSNNPLGVDYTGEKVSFYPYYYVKDLFAFMVFIVIFIYFLFLDPNYLGHPDNYIPANSLKTPAHISPEWYFLPYYAILRAIPSKVGGIVAMFASILVLFLLPFIHFSRIRSSYFRPLFSVVWYLMLINFLILFWLGQTPVQEPYIQFGRFHTFLYFFFFLVLFPWAGLKETELMANRLNKKGYSKVPQYEKLKPFNIR